MPHLAERIKKGTRAPTGPCCRRPVVYGPAHGALVRRWHGHRLLAVDSSVVRLPKSQAAGKQFGWMKCDHDGDRQERYAQGRLSVLYDVINEVGLEARLEPWKLGEEQTLSKQDRAGVRVLATLQAPKELKAEFRKRGWPLEMKVRFVTIRHKTGKLEVLVTSLLDSTVYPNQEFADLYWRRWGHEMFYGRLKGRLDLEHWNGLTVATVAQDFAATILLSDVESILIGPAAAQLAQNTSSRKQPAKINRAVSLHTLKTHLIDLLTSAVPAQKVLDQLTRWFQKNPVSVRPRRKVPRQKASLACSYHYQRYVRKIVF